MTSAQMIRNHVDSAVRFSSPCSGCLLACLPPDFRAGGGVPAGLPLLSCSDDVGAGVGAGAGRCAR